VVRNVAAVTAHLRRRAEAEVVGDIDRAVLALVPTVDGALGVQDADGVWWRAFRFIERAVPAGPVASADAARRVGQGFGRFSRWLSEGRLPLLAETIPGFHDTAARLQALEAAVSADAAGRRGGVQAELAFAEARGRYTAIVPPLSGTAELPLRVVHNDAKAENLLVDAVTGTPLAVVDLDTVMPGTLLADVGDLLRSTAAGVAEDEPDPGRVAARPELVEAVLAGYLSEMGPRLTRTERELLVMAGILIAYEQGVRFLADHLAGDRYYRVGRPGQNLDRARVQFRLVESLETQRAALERAVARLS
jgi:Ser/Thr protein kinase RdoA (MazF antagonist)